MRKSVIAGAAATALLAVLSPVASASAETSSPPSQAGWFPVPTPPFDVPAGVICDSPIHVELPVDKVVERILTRYPDGSPHLAQFTGPLLVRVTNTLTGASTEVDASGSANIEFHEDGSRTWQILGPVLFRFPEGGNLPRGFYHLDGVYRVEQSATGIKNLFMATGTVENICPLID